MLFGARIDKTTIGVALGCARYGQPCWMVGDERCFGRFFMAPVAFTVCLDHPFIRFFVVAIWQPPRLTPAYPAMNKRQLAFFLPTLLIGLAILVYVAYFLVYNYYAFSLFRFPFDYDQGEGFELVDTLLFSKGQWPYRSNDIYPFYSSNYPPVFHLFIVPLVWFFGPRYWTGRLVSYLGTLITAFVIGYAVQRQIKRRWLALIAGLAYLASNYIYHVGPLFRQHLFMVMFETLAVVLLSVMLEREERLNKAQPHLLAGVMGLLLLAGFTKQLAYATVITIFFVLFLRDWRRAVLWAIPFGAAVLLIFFGINIATNGEWYIATVTANINAFVPGQALGLFKQWHYLHLVLIWSAAFYVLYQFYWERLSPYSVWFIFATLNSLTAGKWGAGESYFATAIAASCLLMGLFFGRLLNVAQRHRYLYPLALTIVPLLLLLQANRMFHLPTHTRWLQQIALALGHEAVMYVPPQTSCSARQPLKPIPYVDNIGPTLLGRPPSSADIAGGHAILEILGKARTPIFSEEAAFNLWLGRDVVTNPTQLLNLYNNNRVDLQEMLTAIETQQFDAVLFRAQLYPPPVLEAIGRNYLTTHQIEMNGFVYCILHPKNRLASP